MNYRIVNGSVLYDADTILDEILKVYKEIILVENKLEFCGLSYNIEISNKQKS